MALPKIVFTDIDGVWTDGGMFYDQTGNEWKKFNTADSAGVLFLSYFNIPTIILTGETTEIVARRAAKLGIEHLHQGVKNKLAKATEICRDFGVDLSETAYIGDDINDIQLLKAAGISACPANAPSYVKEHADYLLKKSGGQGAFRELAETLLEENGQLENAIGIYLNKNNLNQ